MTVKTREYELLVWGEWKAAASARWFEVRSPSTSELLANVPDADTADLPALLTGIEQGQRIWSATPASRRSDVLRAARELLLEKRDLLTQLLSAESGKSEPDAAAEITLSASYLAALAEETAKLGIEEQFDAEPRHFDISYQPVGPVLLVTPWNSPLLMMVRKTATALGAGCAAVVKPAEQTPITTFEFAKVLLEAGLPAEALAIVTTTDPGTIVGGLLSSGVIRKLSFTGSTEVGQLLFRECAAQLVRVSLELGGNSPWVVLPGADLRSVAKTTLEVKTRNAGQSCTAPNRILVPADLKEEFVSHLIELMNDTDITDSVAPYPLIDERAIARLASLVKEAEEQGARIRIGGKEVTGTGHFFETTVIDRVDPESPLFRSEIFGPILAITTYVSEADAVELANDSDRGLAGYVFGPTNQATAVARKLEVAMVGVNSPSVVHPLAPFGGIKLSGVGREGGSSALHEFLEPSVVVVVEAS